MAAGQILSMPAAAIGLAPVSGASAWAFGSWVELSSGLSTGVYITGFSYQIQTSPAAADTVYEQLFEIGTGAGGAESTKLQIPTSYRADTITSANNGLGYWMLKEQYVFFPEPYYIPAGTRVAIRVTDSIASALTYGGVKVFYKEYVPLLNTIYDDFDDGVVDSDKWETWTNGTGTVVESGGIVTLTPQSSFAGAGASLARPSTRLTDLTGSAASIKVPHILNANAATESGLFVKRDGNNMLRMNVAEIGQTLYCHKIIDGSYTEVAHVTYNATNHAWWRIRESSGTIYFDAAPDSNGQPGTWSNIGSCANPFSITEIYLEVSAYADNVASPGYMAIDNFNISPVAVVPNTADAMSTTDTTPTLEFTGTDAEDQDVRYQMQIHTDSVFEGTDTITLDASDSSNNTATKSFTVGNHSHRLLLVSYSHYQGSVSPSGITYHGATLTKIKEQVGSNEERTSVWGLIDPDIGTYDVVVTGGGDWFGLGILSLYNCSQTLPHNFTAVTDDTTLDITTGHNGSWVVTSIESETAITINTGTQYWNLEGETYQHGAGSYILKAIAGVQTMDWSQSYGSRSNQINIEVEAYTVTPLINAVSGTDAGFAGSPDNSDPFDSGQLVSYTVQSALDPDTYYWRVRGKDPDGYNLWGPWTTTRSFTITAGTVVNDTRPARTKGKAVTSSTRNARIHGKLLSSDTRNARTKGKIIVSDNRPAKTKGKAVTSSTRPARTHGKLLSSDTRPARSKGKGLSVDNRPARSKGKALTSDNRPARTHGKLLSSDFRSARSKGKAVGSDTRPGRIKGKSLAADTRPGRTKGKAVASDTRPARTHGKLLSADNRLARTKGKNLAADNRSAKTKGVIPGTLIADTRPARTKGKNVASDTRSGRTKGHITTSSTRPARTKGVAVIASSRAARILGFAKASAARAARSIGKALASAIRAARTRGIAIISDIRPARTVGKASASDNRRGRTKGYDVTSSSRNARTFGIRNANSSRGARTRGKGSLSRPGSSLYNRRGELYNNPAGGLYNKSSNPSSPRGGLSSKRI
jgi:hypothetical protein